MDIEVLTVPDCPHRARAMARLRVALATTRTEGAVVSERVIANEAQAAAAGMNGSPTILVDGVDLFAVEQAEPSLSCRLYPSQAGVDGAPAVDALIDALTNPGLRGRADRPASGRRTVRDLQREPRSRSSASGSADHGDPKTACQSAQVPGPANVHNDVGCGDLPADAGVSATGRHLRVAGFVALWRGERLSVADLTDDMATVEALVLGGRLELDDHGVVVGVHGLAARPTPHRIEHAGGVVHTWCALDAIGIPAALALDAAAVTTCPACGAALRVTFDAGVPANDGDLRLWLPGGRCTHLVEDFCRHANLYCTADHVASKVAPGTPGWAATVADAAGIGRVDWADVAPVLRAA
jgi:Alkylmercury lyase